MGRWATRQRQTDVIGCTHGHLARAAEPSLFDAVLPRSRITDDARAARFDTDHCYAEGARKTDCAIFIERIGSKQYAITPDLRLGCRS